eukprot:190605-Rhodomonas_salina.4
MRRIRGESAKTQRRTARACSIRVADMPFAAHSVPCVVLREGVGCTQCPIRSTESAWAAHTCSTRRTESAWAAHSVPGPAHPLPDLPPSPERKGALPQTAPPVSLPSMLGISLRLGYAMSSTDIHLCCTMSGTDGDHRRPPCEPFAPTFLRTDAHTVYLGATVAQPPLFRKTCVGERCSSGKEGETEGKLRLWGVRVGGGKS